MTTPSVRKQGLHPRNRHAQRYDFSALVQRNPALSVFVRIGPQGEPTIDFADRQAVKALNQALLLHFYNLTQWDIPDNYLCPPVPGRADYIHHLADLLAADNHQQITSGASILDIGVGANCIYPLIGQYEYGWRFTGTDVDELALRNASMIIDANKGLNRMIRLRRQKTPEAILSGIIHKNERFDATVCNPPFHDSAEAAHQSNERKRRNLGLDKDYGLNFGGQHKELWCEGGEVAFISRMIKESVAFSHQVLWFTSLVSRGENLPVIYRVLQEHGAVKVVKKEMKQGQKSSRFLAWSFLDDARRDRWITTRFAHSDV